jgi:hypothetical protein
MKRWVNRDNGFWQSLKKYGELDSGKIVVFCSGYNAHTLFWNLQKRGLACREPVIFQARYPGFPYYNPITPCRECSPYSSPGNPLRSSGSIVFCVVFYGSIFVFLSFLVWTMYCLSFWQLRFLITSLAFSMTYIDLFWFWFLAGQTTWTELRELNITSSFELVVPFGFPLSKMIADVFSIHVNNLERIDKQWPTKHCTES